MNYELRIRFIRAKLRNICYYWDYDESLGPLRERRQYIHVLRGLYQQCYELIGKGDQDNLLKGLCGIINPKLGKDEVRETIERLKEYVGKN